MRFHAHRWVRSLRNFCAKLYTPHKCSDELLLIKASFIRNVSSLNTFVFAAIVTLNRNIVPLALYSVRETA